LTVLTVFQLRRAYDAKRYDTLPVCPVRAAIR
jgi:hypothetical protein